MKQQLHGGAADKMDPADFDPAALAEGVKHEREHTTDEAIAREIAMDHLAEDPRYYEKLKRMEKAGHLPLDPPPSPNRAEHPYAGCLTYQGFKLNIENPAGSTRRGVDKDGKPWAQKMTAHYGEFDGTKGADGDPVDCFVGPHADAPFAYVVHTKIPGTEVYDEDKVILGVNNSRRAADLFRANYGRPGFFAGLTRWPTKELLAFLADPAHKGQRLDRPRWVLSMLSKALRGAMGVLSTEGLLKALRRGSAAPTGPQQSLFGMVRPSPGQPSPQAAPPAPAAAPTAAPAPAPAPETPEAPPKPPGDGWGPIPHGHHGGWRRPKAEGGFEYWYPDPQAARHAVADHMERRDIAMATGESQEALHHQRVARGAQDFLGEAPERAPAAPVEEKPEPVKAEEPAPEQPSKVAKQRIDDFANRAAAHLAATSDQPAAGWHSRLADLAEKDGTPGDVAFEMRLLSRWFRNSGSPTFNLAFMAASQNDAAGFLRESLAAQYDNEPIGPIVDKWAPTFTKALAAQRAADDAARYSRHRNGSVPTFGLAQPEPVKAEAPKAEPKPEPPPEPKVAPATPRQRVEALPFASDLSYDRIRSAYYNLSHSPERRAETDIAAYSAHMVDMQAKLGEDFEGYRQGYLRHLSALNDARSRAANWAVTGRGNLNVDRYRKRNEMVDQREQELNQYSSSFIKRHDAKERKKQIADAGGPVEILKRDIAEREKSHAIMIAANAIVRGKGTDEQKIAQMVEAGLSQEDAEDALKPDPIGRKKRVAFDLTNSRAGITRAKERLAEEERKAATAATQAAAGGPQVHRIGDAEVTYNTEADRLQIRFPGKPSSETRAALKSSGWTWAPTNNAWQRKLTDNAVASARQHLKTTDLPFITPDDMKKSPTLTLVWGLNAGR